MNYAGLLRHLEEEKASGRLEQHVKENGEMWCVFLCCDSPLPHVEEYFHTLGDESFPTIHPVPELKTEETSKIDATVESTAALTGGSETISGQAKSDALRSSDSSKSVMRPSPNGKTGTMDGAIHRSTGAGSSILKRRWIAGSRRCHIRVQAQHR